MPPRRQHGEGSICRHHDHPTCPPRDESGKRPDHSCQGRWAATLDLGYGTGRRKQARRYAKTKREAVRKLETMKREMSATGGVARTRHTVETWMQHWLDDIAARRVRPSTLAGYRSKVDRYIVPEIGRLRLGRLEPQHVRALDAALAKRGLSSATRVQTFAILRRALTVAHREGQVPRNVAALIDPPSLTRNRTEPLTIEEISRVLTAARGTEMESRWLAALMLGLRQGEALGLQWGDVDLEAGTLKVERALQRVAGQGLVMVEPKSQKSKRTLPLPRMLAEALGKHRERSWTGGAGTELTAPSGASNVALPSSPGVLTRNTSGHFTMTETAPALVWANPDGSPLDPRADWQAWKDLLSAAGVRHVRLHDARHCVGTLLAAMHIPDVIVSAILGHATVQVTHIYQDANLPMMRQALDMIEAAYRPELEG